MPANSAVTKLWLKPNYGLPFARTSWKISIFAASIRLAILLLIFCAPQAKLIIELDGSQHLD